MMKVDRRGFLGRFGAVTAGAAAAAAGKSVKAAPKGNEAHLDDQGRLILACPACGERSGEPMVSVMAKDGTTLLCQACWKRLEHVTEIRMPYRALVRQAVEEIQEAARPREPQPCAMCGTPCHAVPGVAVVCPDCRWAWLHRPKLPRSPASRHMMEGDT